MFKTFLKKVIGEISEDIKGAVSTINIDSIKDTISQLHELQLDSFRKTIDATLDSDAKKDSSSTSTSSAATSSGPYGLIPAHYRDNVNLNAGISLVSKYQVIVRALHNQGVAIGLRADAEDIKLNKAINICANTHNAWKKLEIELARLPEMAAAISTARTQVDAVIAKIEELEVVLSVQIEKYVADENIAWMERQQADMIKHEAQKKRDLGSLEQELAIQRERTERDRWNKERARLFTEENEKRRAALKETLAKAEEDRKQADEDRRRAEEKRRQENKLRSAFENAFKKDMSDYKSTQSTHPATEPSASLDLVVPVVETEETEQLETFLEAVKPEDLAQEESDSIIPSSPREDDESHTKVTVMADSHEVPRPEIDSDSDSDNDDDDDDNSSPKEI